MSSNVPFLLTVSTSHMRHTVILHHPHRTRITNHGRTRTRDAIRRLMPSSSILLWIIHHVLLRLLARLGLLLVVGVMGLGRCAIEG